MSKTFYKCTRCGNDFSRYGSQSHKYCSMQCSSSARTSRIEKECEICKTSFFVIKSRNDAKTCSIQCQAIRAGRLLSKKVDIQCPICKKTFAVKISHSKRRMCCSRPCMAEDRKSRYYGSKNPNYRGHTVRGGYTIKVPSWGGKSISLHKVIVLEFFEFKKLGKGWCIHHRDADKMNNTADNLVVLDNSDHTWLHKQFGNATLSAYLHGRIDLDSLASWSDDPDRSRKLLPLNLEGQKPYSQKFLGDINDKVQAVDA